LYEASGAVKPRRKRVKREAIVGPAADTDIVHEAVGLKPASLVPKEIPVIKKKNPVLQVIFCLIEMFFGFSDHFYKCSCSSIVYCRLRLHQK
jgi:hypothetical protein